MTEEEKELAIKSEQERLVPIVLDFVWRHWGMDYDDVYGKCRDGRTTAEHLKAAMEEGTPYTFGKCENIA